MRNEHRRLTMTDLPPLTLTSDERILLKWSLETEGVKLEIAEAVRYKDLADTVMDLRCFQANNVMNHCDNEPSHLLKC